MLDIQSVFKELIQIKDDSIKSLNENIKTLNEDIEYEKIKSQGSCLTIQKLEEKIAELENFSFSQSTEIYKLNSTVNLG